MSSYNPNTALAGTQTLPMIQAYLNNMLVGMEICRKDLRDYLRAGEKLDMPYVPRNYVQPYTQGIDMNFPAKVGVSDVMTVDQSRAVNFTLGKNELVQAQDKSYQAKLSKQAAFELAQDMDQQLIKEGVDNASASNLVAAGSLNSSNIYSTLTTVMSRLQRSNASGTKFAILDPERVALLAQNEVANGWTVADSALRNGFVGDSNAGFKIFMSNNLPTRVVLTLDTIPVATNTFSLFGVTFTCVADGTATNPGEVNVGADLADFKTIIVKVINGTASADYVDVSDENRMKLKAAGIAAATFAGNDCVITAYGKIGATETFGPAGDVFGTETGSLLAGDYGAICFAAQRLPELDTAVLPNRPQEQNWSYSTLWAKKVFHRDADRLSNITINI